MLTWARWPALSASETKYSVACGCGVAGDVQVTGVIALAGGKKNKQEHAGEGGETVHEAVATSRIAVSFAGSFS